jgi:FMN reductase
MKLRILGVCGSLREGSFSNRGVALALEAAEAHGAETRLLDLREADLPMYRSPRAKDSKSVEEMNEAVHWADAFILSSPDYHGSMSGAVKNFFDYHHRQFSGKLFGYIVASHEKGLTVMEQMRTAVRQCYGWSLPYGVSFDSSDAFDEEGNLKSAQVEHRIRMLARDVTVYGRILRAQFLQDLASEELDTFAARYR